MGIFKKGNCGLQSATKLDLRLGDWLVPLLFRLERPACSQGVSTRVEAAIKQWTGIRTLRGKDLCVALEMGLRLTELVDKKLGI